MNYSDNPVLGSIANREVQQFARKVLKTSYRNIFPDLVPKVDLMLREVFGIVDHVIPNLCSTDTKVFQLTNKISNSLFHHQDPLNWYPRAYKKYKSLIQTKYFISCLKDNISGRRVYDFGCGRGYLARALSRMGYEVWCSDRHKDFDIGNGIKYHSMKSANDIPFEDEYFGTTIVSGVLHHIEAKDQRSVIRNLKRITKTNILVREDLVDIHKLEGKWKTGRDVRNCSTDFMEQYIRFSTREQIQYMAFLDFFGIGLVQGETKYIPYTYHSYADWAKLFNLRIVETQMIYFSKYMLHKTPEVWIHFIKT